MPKMHIHKSTEIKAPVDKIFNTLNDFTSWTAWSPWLIMEPEAKVDIADDGKYYSWKGERVGTGNMKITNEVSDKSIDYDLNFLTPWKSSAKVRFEFEPAEDGTKVNWLMDSSLPIFLFWMKKMMVAFVGMDYERGLAMLKDYVEDGEVHSKLEFKGNESYPGCNYIGLKSTCSKQALAESMEKDFQKIDEFAKAMPELVAGKPFTIYHKWDMVNEKIIYTSGIPINKTPEQVPESMIMGEIPKTEMYTVAHTGPYNHLGNAWSTLYNMERSKSIKVNKKIHPFETYINDPAEVGENELITEVHFATKPK